MIPKPDKDPDKMGNYRPISLLCTMGKVLERILAKRYQVWLANNNIMNKWQRAYLPRKEGWEHLNNLWEEVRLAKSSKRFTTVFSLDVEKAFDTVWHDGLLYKLLRLGIPPYLLRITANFLQDRSIRIKCGTSLSAPVKLKAGTPQGSVLSPTLYNIYVNDLPLEYQGTQAGQFADDVSKWVSSKKVKSNYIKLQHSLDLITAWCNNFGGGSY